MATGYQFSALKNPVNNWTRAEETRTATEARSSPFFIDFTGGQRKRFGYTDHSLTRSKGIDAVPVATCRP